MKGIILLEIGISKRRVKTIVGVRPSISYKPTWIMEVGVGACLTAQKYICAAVAAVVERLHGRVPHVGAIGGHQDGPAHDLQTHDRVRDPVKSSIRTSAHKRIIRTDPQRESEAHCDVACWENDGLKTDVLGVDSARLT